MMTLLRVLKFMLLVASSALLLHVREAHSWSTKRLVPRNLLSGIRTREFGIKQRQQPRQHQFLFGFSIYNQLDANTLYQKQCKFCSKKFDSRNALFRHVRTDPVCAELANEGKDNQRFTQTVRQALAFKFSYFAISRNPAEHKIQQENKICEAEMARGLLLEAVENALNGFVNDELHFNNTTVDIIHKQVFVSFDIKRYPKNPVVLLKEMF